MLDTPPTYTKLPKAPGTAAIYPKSLLVLQMVAVVFKTHLTYTIWLAPERARSTTPCGVCRGRPPLFKIQAHDLLEIKPVFPMKQWVREATANQAPKPSRNYSAKD